MPFILCSVFTSVWKSLMRAVLVQLWSPFTILCAWWIAPEAFLSLLSRWHSSSIPDYCDGESKGGGIQKPIIRGEMFIFLLSWKGARRTKWILLLPPDLSLNKVECRRGPCTSTFCDMYKRWKGFEYFQRTRRKVCSHRPRGAMTLSLSWALCTWIDALHSRFSFSTCFVLLS